MGCSLKVAKQHYNSFWNTYTPLNSLKDDLVKVWNKRGGKNKGFLRGLDGRKLFARSPHSLVNMMFQSAGSILVKTAACFMDGAIKKNNLDCTQILFYHDELEYEVKEEQADFAGKLASKSFELAGKHHKFNVSIIGEYKIGRSWYDCHG
jgi:DNA polymerase I-like protein with 3'-5' exonuclease and polymerase domains